MSLLHRCLAAAVALVLSGCAMSVEPVVSPAEAVFDPKLIGTWASVGDSDTARVSKGEGSTYRLLYTDKAETGRYDARLGRLGRHWVLDVWPAPESKSLDPYSPSLIAGHVLFDIRIEQNEVTIAMIERETMLAALRAGRLKLPFSDNGQQLVLLAKTTELRKALGPYLDAPRAFAEQSVLRRVP